jgi:hypothetical protein
MYSGIKAFAPFNFTLEFLIYGFLPIILYPSFDISWGTEYLPILLIATSLDYGAKYSVPPCVDFLGLT